MKSTVLLSSLLKLLSISLKKDMKNMQTHYWILDEDLQNDTVSYMYSNLASLSDKQISSGFVVHSSLHIWGAIFTWLFTLGDILTHFCTSDIIFTWLCTFWRVLFMNGAPFGADLSCSCAQFACNFHKLCTCWASVCDFIIRKVNEWAMDLYILENISILLLPNFSGLFRYGDVSVYNFAELALIIGHCSI